jgi:hypothetical protein
MFGIIYVWNLGGQPQLGFVEALAPDPDGWRRRGFNRLPIDGLAPNWGSSQPKSRSLLILFLSIFLLLFPFHSHSRQQLRLQNK